MKYIVIFALLCCIALTKNDIEHVQELLLNLKNDIHEQIIALDNQWELTQKAKQASIQALQQNKIDQENECSRRNQDIINKENEIQETSDFISWIQHRITLNKARIQTLEDLQCKQSLNFIDTIKDDKIQLTVSIFIKEQLEKILSEATSFTQKTQAMKNILAFIQDVKENKYEMFELQRLAEVEREENPSLVELGPIELKKFQEVKNEILTVLDELEAHINSAIPLAQTNIIRVGLAFIEYKQRIFSENEFFESKIVELGKQLEHLQDQLVALQYSATQCQNRVEDIDRAITVAKNDALLAFDQYTNEHDRLIQQLAIFAEIYQLYDKQVDNKTTEAEKEALTEELPPIQELHQYSEPEQTQEEQNTEEEQNIEEEQQPEAEEENFEEETNLPGSDPSSIQTEEVFEEEAEEEEAVEYAEEELTEEQAEEELNIVGDDPNSLPPVEITEVPEVEEQPEQNNEQQNIPQEVEVPQLDSTPEDLEQLNLINKGPLKLRQVESAPSFKRADFILLQMKQKKSEPLDEIIL